MATKTGAQGVTGSSSALDTYTIWHIAGQCPAWDKAHVVDLMTAVALAESGGDPNAENYCCVGLWQINVLAHKQYTRSQMKDPYANMRAACAIYSSQGLAAWESYTNGAYKKFQTDVNKAVGSARGTATPDFQIPSVANPLDWAKELAKILSFLSSSSGWIRIGKVVLGVTLLVIAIDQLTKIGPGPETNISGAVGGAVKTSPYGKAVRLKRK